MEKYRISKNMGIFVDDEIREAQSQDSVNDLTGSHNSFQGFRREIQDNENFRIAAAEMGPQMPQSSAFEEDQPQVQEPPARNRPPTQLTMNSASLASNTGQAQPPRPS